MLIVVSVLVTDGHKVYCIQIQRSNITVILGSSSSFTFSAYAVAAASVWWQSRHRLLYHVSLVLWPSQHLSDSLSTSVAFTACCQFRAIV